MMRQLAAWFAKKGNLGGAQKRSHFNIVARVIIPRNQNKHNYLLKVVLTIAQWCWRVWMGWLQAAVASTAPREKEVTAVRSLTTMIAETITFLREERLS
jgi:hypothetical protein